MIKHFIFTGQQHNVTSPEYNTRLLKYRVALHLSSTIRESDIVMDKNLAASLLVIDIEKQMTPKTFARFQLLGTFFLTGFLHVFFDLGSVLLQLCGLAFLQSNG